jgi:hypothetical protein
VARGVVSDLGTRKVAEPASEIVVQEIFTGGRRIHVAPNTVEYRVSGWTDPSAAQAETGVFLTRASVPERAALASLAVAGVLLGALSRRMGP